MFVVEGHFASRNNSGIIGIEQGDKEESQQYSGQWSVGGGLGGTWWPAGVDATLIDSRQRGSGSDGGPNAAMQSMVRRRG